MKLQLIMYVISNFVGSRYPRFDPTAYKSEKDRRRKEIELKQYVIFFPFPFKYTIVLLIAVNYTIIMFSTLFAFSSTIYNFHHIVL